MKTGANGMPAAGRDGVVRAAMMAVRVGFVLALVLGLLGWFGQTFYLGAHIAAGGLVLGGILVAGARLLTQGRGGAMLLVALAVGLAGAVMAAGGVAGGVVHLVLMLAAVGLAEMTAAKAKKAA